MADLGTALHTRLKDGSAGAIVATRIYPRIRPQNSPLPAITYTVPGGARDATLKGLSQTRRPRVQIDCWAETYAQSRALADAAVADLSTPATVAGLKFGRASADEPRDLGEDTGGKYLHRASVDLLVEYRIV